LYTALPSVFAILAADVAAAQEAERVHRERSRK
jgi:hypothetical protein